MTTTDDVVNFMIDNRAPALEAKMLADLLDRLVWTLNDNGRDIARIRQAWIEGADEYRVEVALLMEEFFPYHSAEEMKVAFTRVAARWPRFGPLCDRVSQAWMNQSQ